MGAGRGGFLFMTPASCKPATDFIMSMSDSYRFGFPARSCSIACLLNLIVIDGILSSEAASRNGKVLTCVSVLTLSSARPPRYASSVVIESSLNKYISSPGMVLITSIKSSTDFFGTNNSFFLSDFHLSPLWSIRSCINDSRALTSV